MTVQPGHQRTPRRLPQSSKLADVLYEIRGPVNAEAQRMEAAGEHVLKLNIGNPAPFDFPPPSDILRDMIATLPVSHGYSESKGILSARHAVVDRYNETPGFPQVDVDDVYLGNGVSELIMLLLNALLDDGDEVLVPAPDYPLWTAATSLSGGRPVHYVCDEATGWNPDVADIEAKVTDRTKAIVVINPNNPTGAVYSDETLRALADVARRHGLLLFADEIYDRITYDGVPATNLATFAPDLLCVTLNGLSKTYRVAGFRSAWMVISGPREHARGFLEGVELLTSTRLCANVPGQQAIQAALGGRQSIEDLLLPMGRLTRSRDVAWEGLNRIEGVSCVKPTGALYAFPRLDPEVHEIRDDQQFALDLLRSEKILVTHGSGFNIPTTDHFRVVTLPHPDDLTVAVERMGNFLRSYRQG
ncbi:pyridoxal phosphate-dependent aminotransferase [Kytococcus sp. HMSC28H12]|uniref:pyridoxal phosphate-dependent aminotransferase n=1 Tax=Kytococcus TaxID=57499 RepID=UPI0008A28927|nr:pyridoxal phosphate-dependent aminotransferase [Kytococcus sp. HMSC28H12]OFS14676.1 aminotransferase [Kytococcus sp. HMSC28H12]